MIVAVEAVVLEGNKYLIIKRSLMEEHAPGTYSLPGGKVELADDGSGILEKNLEREVYEETSINIDVKSINYLESKLFYTNDNTPVIDVVYTCRCIDTSIKDYDKNEVSEVLWLTYEEIEAMKEPIMPYYVKEIIRKVEDLNSTKS